MMLNLSYDRSFGLWTETESHLRWYRNAPFPRRSIYDYAPGPGGGDFDPRVLNYLENGYFIAGSRSIEQSIFNPEVMYSGDLSPITDGKWIWFQNVIHYYKTDHIALPIGLLENIQSNHFNPPVFDFEEKKQLIQQYQALTTT